MKPVFDMKNEVLTAYAQSLFANPDQMVDLSVLFFPTTPVDEAIGEYDIYDLDAALTEADTTLARNNSPLRLQLRGEKGYYSCEPAALEIATWAPAMLQKSGPRVREDATRTLMSAQFIARQASAARLVKEAVTATSFSAKWSAADTDVLAQVNKLCRQVATGCGYAPNTIAMGHGAWDTLRNHPTMKTRFAAIDYALKEDAFLSMLSYRGIKLVVVDTMVRVSGQMVPVMDNDVIVFYNQANPTRDDMSFGKEFTLTPKGPEVISYKEHGIYDVDMLLWSSCRKVVHAESCARLVVA